MGIKDKIEEVKSKSDAVINAVTNKAFDVNLLKAIGKDFDFIIQQQNDIIKGEVFLFQLLKPLIEKEGISIPNHIKKHFTIEV